MSPTDPHRLHRKVSAAAAGGAVSTVLVWGLELAHVGVPSAVAAAFTTLATVACGYLTTGST